MIVAVVVSLSVLVTHCNLEIFANFSPLFGFGHRDNAHQINQRFDRDVTVFLDTHPEIMEEQLHAIFTAAKNRSIKIMFPMVSSVDEFNEAKTLPVDIK